MIIANDVRFVAPLLEKNSISIIKKITLDILDYLHTHASAPYSLNILMINANFLSSSMFPPVQEKL